MTASDWVTLINIFVPIIMLAIAAGAAWIVKGTHAGINAVTKDQAAREYMFDCVYAVEKQLFGSAGSVKRQRAMALFAEKFPGFPSNIASVFLEAACQSLDNAFTADVTNTPVPPPPAVSVPNVWTNPNTAVTGSTTLTIPPMSGTVTLNPSANAGSMTANPPPTVVTNTPVAVPPPTTDGAEKK